MSQNLTMSVFPTTDVPSSWIFSAVLAIVVTGTVFAFQKYRSRYKLPDFAALTGVPNPAPIEYFPSQCRPYRPFRWPYHQTMVLFQMEPNYWLELDQTYVDKIKQRRELYKRHGKHIADALPGTEDACVEIMQMAIQFLCHRYPNQFSYSDTTGIFTNHVLNSKWKVNEVNPFVFLVENVPEEFMMVFEDPKTGLYHFRAGVCCSALGWNVGTKMGMPLHEIHDIVPRYPEKLKTSMDRWFSKLPVNKPIQRGSWGLEIGEVLYLQPSDPHWSVRSTQPPDLKIEDIYLRVDWQTLRRLPKSRAVVFNFKALFTPFSDFRREPYIPKLLKRILTEGDDKIMEYKGADHVLHRALPALDEWAKEQEDDGTVPSGWVEKTLLETPFFPGYKSP